jgi:ferredoxin/flavodoxin---NADP+ reductase
MSAHFEEEVLSVHHWTDRLFSFTTTRSPTFRYENGQFTMIGLPADGKPLLRAYSLVSPNYSDQLEFLSIKVPGGPLTSKLQHLKVGDKLLVGKKATGTLLIDNLLPGRNLYLLGTGTGLAPFMSIAKDPQVYDRFEKIILVHGCRFKSELAYAEMIENVLPDDELLGEEIRSKLLYYPTVTREEFRNRGRITAALSSGALANSLGLDPLDPEHDRVMVCGSPAFLSDITELLKERSFAEGSGNEPGSYVIEKAFVER